MVASINFGIHIHLSCVFVVLVIRCCCGHSHPILSFLIVVVHTSRVLVLCSSAGYSEQGKLGRFFFYGLYLIFNIALYATGYSVSASTLSTTGLSKYIPYAKVREQSGCISPF